MNSIPEQVDMNPIFINLCQNFSKCWYCIYCCGKEKKFGGREIAQEGGEIFPETLGKILGKFCEFKISPKPQH